MHPNVNARSYSLGIFIGFAAFFMMEKTLRVLSGGEAHTHSHEGHGDLSNATTDESTSSAVETHSSSSGMRSRNHANTEQSDKHEPQSKDANNVGGPSKSSAYLNLFGDFVHNM